MSDRADGPRCGFKHGDPLPDEDEPSAEQILVVCRRIVSAQAEDGALWCPLTATEAYAVQELRTLHRAVEGDLAAAAAIEDP